ncbi:MAG TPA: helix-turn-helix domain-containing protein [Phycisphaerales bacterium]|nr:helix-turn-helix domain-containing protein [Phycisphaerales bacterium]
MTTAERINDVRTLTQEQQKWLLAIGIVTDRMARLTKEDSDLMLGFFQDLNAAESDEDRNAALEAMFELLEGKPVGVRKLDLERETNDEGGKLQAWKEWVSAKIREVRNQKGLTQEQLAEKTGLPQSHLSRIENAKHSPSRVTLEKIADALGVPVKLFDPTCED